MKILAFDRLDDLGDDFIERCMSFLPAWRKEQMLKFKHNRGKIECATAYLLLYALLHLETGRSNIDFSFVYNEHGKPYFDCHLDYYFSISHCKSTVAVALSDDEIGIDVEEKSRYKESLARYVCNDEELKEISGSDDESATFIKLWTRKEAVFKLLGTGITHDIKDILSNNDVHVITKEFDGIVLSVASKKEIDDAVETIFVSKERLLSFFGNEDCGR